MTRDLLTDRPDPAFEADVAIVGAGAAGITLAVELARLGQRVVLLEGGGATPEDDSQDLYRGELPGLPHRGIHTGRFRVQGGTTTMWGGQILELDSIDFRERSWIPGSGWPITKADLAPFYVRALAVEGVASSILEDAEVWRRLKLPQPEFGTLQHRELVSYLSRWCPEPNFAHLHGAALAGDAIHLWLHSNAVELVFADDRVIGVRCRTLAGQQAVFRARTIVLALGAIETSRFLLQPRPDGARLPWNQSGLLGQHFQDHIDADAATLRPTHPARLHQAFDTIFVGGYKYAPKLKLTAEAQQQAGILNVGGTVYSVSDLDSRLAETKAAVRLLLRGRLGALTGPQLPMLLRNLPLLAQQGLRYTLQHRAWHPAGAELRLRVHCEQLPLSASAITLSDDRDALGLLRTRLCWRIDPAELRAIRHFVTIARSALAGLAEVIPHPDLFAPDGSKDDDRFVRYCEDSYHHMGGARMHPSASHGVVDTDLRLHGTSNVHICSSAVFPTSGFSNPTHTLLALAVRLADHLGEHGGLQ